MPRPGVHTFHIHTQIGYLDPKDFSLLVASTHALYSTWQVDTIHPLSSEKIDDTQPSHQYNT